MSKADKMRPICSNDGCNKGCHNMVGNDKMPRYRAVCGSCHAADMGNKAYGVGVIPIKTGICSNIDGHLGWVCPVNWDLVPKWASGMTDIDHIDGNRYNNNPGNHAELCPMCHRPKGQRSGDTRLSKTSNSADDQKKLAQRKINQADAVRNKANKKKNEKLFGTFFDES